MGSRPRQPLDAGARLQAVAVHPDRVEVVGPAPPWSGMIAPQAPRGDRAGNSLDASEQRFERLDQPEVPWIGWASCPAVSGSGRPSSPSLSVVAPLHGSGRGPPRAP